MPSSRAKTTAGSWGGKLDECAVAGWAGLDAQCGHPPLQLAAGQWPARPATGKQPPVFVNPANDGIAVAALAHLDDEMVDGRG